MVCGPRRVLIEKMAREVGHEQLTLNYLVTNVREGGMEAIERKLTEVVEGVIECKWNPEQLDHDDDDDDDDVDDDVDDEREAFSPREPAAAPDQTSTSSERPDPPLPCERDSTSV
jgi:uncharacterized protein YfkK (UPF0435 family)